MPEPLRAPASLPSNRDWCRVWDGNELICDRPAGHADDQPDGLHHRGHVQRDGRGRFLIVWWHPDRPERRIDEGPADPAAVSVGKLTTGVITARITVPVPGAAGNAMGPGPDGYRQPHVYARSVHSNSGNCICGSALGDRLHTEAAAGVPIPEVMRW